MNSVFYEGRIKITEDMKFPVEWIVPMMSIPNAAAMMQIYHHMLASEGFFNAQTLASKLFTCLKNVSNTSLEMWYFDFGIRAAKSTFAMAGYFRRTDQTLDESMALCIAIYKNIGYTYPEEDKEALANFFLTTFVGPNQ